MALQIQTTATAKPSFCPLVYGPAKSGKTRLAKTCPNPFIISTDDGLASVRDANIPFYQITKWQEFLEAYKWMFESKEARNYQTIIIDDLTEAAEMLLVQEKPRHKNAMQAYGEMGEVFGKMLREMRNIRDRFILLLCKQEKVQDQNTGIFLQYPMLPGKMLQTVLPFLMGEIYHMESWTDPKTNQVYEVLRTKRTDTIEAGSRFNLGEIEFANMTAIFQRLYQA